jgi:hypothetical protein
MTWEEKYRRMRRRKGGRKGVQGRMREIWREGSINEEEGRKRGREEGEREWSGMGKGGMEIKGTGLGCVRGGMA